MAINLSNTLIVGISATALFDLGDAEAFFEQAKHQNVNGAVEAYRDYMVARENQPLATGTGYPLINALLNLNKYQQDNNAPLVEVVILSKNSPDTGIQVLNAIKAHKLPISRSAFTSGESVATYVSAFNIDLFLTTNATDAQKVTDSGVCASAVLTAPPVNIAELDSKQLRIAFDGDAVLFDESGELVYKQKGLKAFHDREANMQDKPLEKGPYAAFLIKLSKLQQRLPAKLVQAPIRIALVTARNSPADLRAIKTLRAWGVNVDVAFFLGGLEKTAVLKAFAPHIFFDDQAGHIDKAAGFVPSAKVPYHSNSPLKLYEKQTFVPIKQ